MASQITSLATVYSTVYLGGDQRKHQSSASLTFVRGIHWWPVNSKQTWPVTQKIFRFEDVIMVETLCPSSQYLAFISIFDSCWEFVPMGFKMWKFHVDLYKQFKCALSGTRFCHIEVCKKWNDHRQQVHVYWCFQSLNTISILLYQLTIGRQYCTEYTSSAIYTNMY